MIITTYLFAVGCHNRGDELKRSAGQRGLLDKLDT